MNTRTPWPRPGHFSLSARMLVLLCALCLLAGCRLMERKFTDTSKIDPDVDAALNQLFQESPDAKDLATQAHAILVFPNMMKAGFIGGAEYGTGAMRKNGVTVGYYSLKAGTYGLQAGVQSYSYAMFFMNDEALASLNDRRGLEVGVGPSVVMFDQGVGKKLTSTTRRDDVYAFVFGQQGLMAGLGMQGSRIVRLDQ